MMNSSEGWCGGRSEVGGEVRLCFGQARGSLCVEGAPEMRFFSRPSIALARAAPSSHDLSAHLARGQYCRHTVYIHLGRTSRRHGAIPWLLPRSVGS